MQGQKEDGETSSIKLQTPDSKLQAPNSQLTTHNSKLQNTIPADSIKEPVLDVAEPADAENIVIPVAMPIQQDPTPMAAVSATIEIDPSAATSRTSELAEAASAVAETISVTPALARGDGEVVIRLKPTVLDGSEIRLEASGHAITVEISPATAEAAHAVERAQAKFAQQLSERLPSFQFTVAVVAAKPISNRKSTINETT